MKSKQLQNRWLIFLMGILIQNFGLYLNARCGLGTSALLSVAFVGGLVWNISFGDATIVVMGLYVLAQFVVRGRKHRQFRDILQLPLAIVVGEIFNLLDMVFPVDTVQSSMALRVLCLCAALTFNGIGATVAMNMRLIPNPGDGIVQALSDRFGLELGKMKRIMDCSMVALATVFSFAALGRLEGVGIGTVCAMLIVGKIVSAVNGRFGPKLRAAAGLEG